MLALRKSLPLFNRNGKFSMLRNQLKHTLPEMPYPFNALEPIICSDILEVHYGKHHAAYVNNLNVAEEKLQMALAKKDFVSAASHMSAVKFNGGGHINHSIYWKSLIPCCNFEEPSPELLCEINNSFGSFEKMKELMSALAIGIRGSGWAWLAFDPVTKRLQLATSANQEILESVTGLIPLFCIDVWEHAYYLQYKNARADYVKNIWSIINWKFVCDRLCKAKGK